MKSDSAGATKGPGMRSSLRVGIFTAVGTAFVLYGPAVLADSGPEHQIEQPGPIYLGTTGSNIDDFGEVIIDDTIVEVCFTGTLGALVEDEGGALYILGNNHVLARTNQGSLGEAIIQPGLGDQNSDPDFDSVCYQDTADTVANLTDFVPIKFGARAGPFFRFKSNTVDAAIAQIVVGAVDTSGVILDVGVPDPSPAAATLGTLVTKSGRTTGQTSGNVAAVDVEVFVCYADPCDVTDVARFVSQIRIDGNFSLPGDSGSLIVSDDLDHHPVALLFAGGNNSTFANPIDLVLSSFNVAMAGCSADPDCGGGEIDDGGGKGKGPGGGGPPGKNKSVPAGLETASQVKARHAEELFAIRGVVGTGISVDDAGRPVIEVYVESAARDAEHPIPTELEGIPVRVVVTGKIIAY